MSHIFMICFFINLDMNFNQNSQGRSSGLGVTKYKQSFLKAKEEGSGVKNNFQSKN